MRTYIIAEIGVNHNGDIGLAKKMIEAALQCGCDAVKFQTFSAERLVSPQTPKVAYQLSTTSPSETHYEMIKSLELRLGQFEQLKEYCDSVGIDFISTPYDVESARFLSSLNVAKFKTASADIVDVQLHHYLASTGTPVLIACGMATLGEIEAALSIYSSKSALCLLHCVSNYPCSLSSLNLNVLTTLQHAFHIPVGYSDHSVGHSAALLSIALGAQVVEKHFTLDKTLSGPDHKASIEPAEMRALVSAIRDAEIALGSYSKRCQEEEAPMAAVSRKSLVMKHGVKKGHVISEDDVVLRRPGTGISPLSMHMVIGKSVRHDLDSDHLLMLGDIE
jgi:N-acetylneuraminate synthase